MILANALFVGMNRTSRCLPRPQADLAQRAVAQGAGDVRLLQFTCHSERRAEPTETDQPGEVLKPQRATSFLNQPGSREIEI